MLRIQKISSICNFNKWSFEFFIRNKGFMCHLAIQAIMMMRATASRVYLARQLKIYVYKSR